MTQTILWKKTSIRLSCCSLSRIYSKDSINDKSFQYLVMNCYETRAFVFQIFEVFQPLSRRMHQKIPVSTMQ